MRVTHPTPTFSFLNIKLFQGFTLAELLIALAILGVIATFTIPKVIQSQNDSKRLAVFKETIAALNGAFNAGWAQGEVSDANFGTYMIAHLNTYKVCDTNGVTQGCWTSGVDPVSGQSTEKGVILHNGAAISGLDDNDGGTGRDSLVIDWNGSAGPNVEGDDILVLHAIFTTAGGSRTGAIRENTSFPNSVALWGKIFSSQ